VDGGREGFAREQKRGSVSDPFIGCDATLVERTPNTLTILYGLVDPVKVPFFGGVS